jgi:cell division protein FtsB
VAGALSASRKRAGGGPRSLSLGWAGLAWTLRLSVALGLAVGLGYLPYKLYLRSGLVQYVTLRQELAALTARNESLQGSIRELRHQLERMKDDPAAIERVARDELGMVRSGEVVFKVE